MAEWDGRPQDPERDGWHWLMLDAMLYPARWDEAASAWHQSRFLTPAEIARLNDYCGPCLTPAEIERLRAALLKIATMRPPIPEDEEGHAPNWDQYVFTRTWAAFAAELQRIANTALGEARRD